MPKNQLDSDHSANQYEKSRFPSSESAIQILPVSHNEFLARWSLSEEALNSGLEAAAKTVDESHLVLRAYSLPPNSDHTGFSDVWQDFSIKGSDESAYFTLPTPTPKINAAIGLINKSERFNPLVRGEAVSLPPPPNEQGDTPDAESSEIIKRTSESPDSQEPLEIEPVPDKRIGYHSPPSHANSQSQEDEMSDLFANQWDENWSGESPVELRAEFVLTGKVASGTKILLGNRILEPNSEGFVVWRQKLDSFKQIWPLLQEAISSPSVSAGPSMEFFKEVDPSDTMLELHAALRISGKVNDPDHYSKLPEGLTVDSNGEFKLTRMLPDGAVILPGISLITQQ